MKLYIDDIRNTPDDTWKLARTVEAAINAIDVFDFEVISLDHDISHQVVIGKLSRPYPCEETFYSVAMFIKQRYAGTALKKPKIIIHTANPVGALRMTATLEGFEIERKDSYPANRLETIL